MPARDKGVPRLDKQPCVSLVFSLECPTLLNISWPSYWTNCVTPLHQVMRIGILQVRKIRKSHSVAQSMHPKINHLFIFQQSYQQEASKAHENKNARDERKYDFLNPNGASTERNETGSTNCFIKCSLWTNSDSHFHQYWIWGCSDARSWCRLTEREPVDFLTRWFIVDVGTQSMERKDPEFVFRFVGRMILCRHAVYRHLGRSADQMMNYSTIQSQRRSQRMWG